MQCDSAIFPGYPLRRPKPNRSFFFKTGAPGLAILADMVPISAEVSYIEIGVSDASKSRAFLEQMFGWTFHPFGQGVRSASRIQHRTVPSARHPQHGAEEGSNGQRHDCDEDSLQTVFLATNSQVRFGKALSP